MPMKEIMKGMFQLQEKSPDERPHELIEVSKNMWQFRPKEKKKKLGKR